jgi:hypothetical protein
VNKPVKEKDIEKGGGCVDVGHAQVESGNDALLLCARYAFFFVPFFLCLLNFLLSVCQRAMRLLQHDDFFGPDDQAAAPMFPLGFSYWDT